MARNRLYNPEYLKELVSDPNSGVELKESVREILLQPFHLRDLSGAVAEILDGCLLRYDPLLDGLPLGYFNARLLGEKAPCHLESSQVSVKVQATFYVFKPRIGNTYRAVVHKIGVAHVGGLLYHHFNISLPIPKEKLSLLQKLILQTNVTFVLEEMELTGDLPFFKGQLLSVKFKPVDKFIEAKTEKKSKKLKSGDQDTNLNTLNEISCTFNPLAQSTQKPSETAKENYKKKQKEAKSAETVSTMERLSRKDDQKPEKKKRSLSLKKTSEGEESDHIITPFQRPREGSHHLVSRISPRTPPHEKFKGLMKSLVESPLKDFLTNSEDESKSDNGLFKVSQGIISRKSKGSQQLSKGNDLNDGVASNKKNSISKTNDVKNKKAVNTSKDKLHLSKEDTSEESISVLATAGSSDSQLRKKQEKNISEDSDSNDGLMAQLSQKFVASQSKLGDKSSSMFSQKVLSPTKTSSTPNKIQTRSDSSSEESESEERTLAEKSIHKRDEDSSSEESEAEQVKPSQDFSSKSDKGKSVLEKLKETSSEESDGGLMKEALYDHAQRWPDESDSNDQLTSLGVGRKSSNVNPGDSDAEVHFPLTQAQPQPSSPKKNPGLSQTLSKSFVTDKKKLRDDISSGDEFPMSSQLPAKRPLSPKKVLTQITKTTAEGTQKKTSLNQVPSVKTISSKPEESEESDQGLGGLLASFNSLQKQEHPGVSDSETDFDESEKQRSKNKPASLTKAVSQVNKESKSSSEDSDDEFIPPSQPQLSKSRSPMKVSNPKMEHTVPVTETFSTSEKSKDGNTNVQALLTPKKKLKHFNEEVGKKSDSAFQKKSVCQPAFVLSQSKTVSIGKQSSKPVETDSEESDSDLAGTETSALAQKVSEPSDFNSESDKSGKIAATKAVPQENEDSSSEVSVADGKIALPVSQLNKKSESTQEVPTSPNKTVNKISTKVPQFKDTSSEESESDHEAVKTPMKKALSFQKSPKLSLQKIKEITQLKSTDDRNTDKNVLSMALSVQKSVSPKMSSSLNQSVSKISTVVPQLQDSSSEESGSDFEAAVKKDPKSSKLSLQRTNEIQKTTSSNSKTTSASRKSDSSDSEESDEENDKCVSTLSANLKSTLLQAENPSKESSSESDSSDDAPLPSYQIPKTKSLSPQKTHRLQDNKLYKSKSQGALRVKSREAISESDSNDCAPIPSYQMSKKIPQSPQTAHKIPITKSTECILQTKNSSSESDSDNNTGQIIVKELSSPQKMINKKLIESFLKSQGNREQSSSEDSNPEEGTRLPTQVPIKKPSSPVKIPTTPSKKLKETTLKSKGKSNASSANDRHSEDDASPLSSQVPNKKLPSPPKIPKPASKKLGESASKPTMSSSDDSDSKDGSPWLSTRLSSKKSTFSVKIPKTLGKELIGNALKSQGKSKDSSSEESEEEASRVFTQISKKSTSPEKVPKTTSKELTKNAPKSNENPINSSSEDSDSEVEVPRFSSQVPSKNSIPTKKIPETTSKKLPESAPKSNEKPLDSSSEDSDSEIEVPQSSVQVPSKDSTPTKNVPDTLSKKLPKGAPRSNEKPLDSSSEDSDSEIEIPRFPTEILSKKSLPTKKILETLSKKLPESAPKPKPLDSSSEDSDSEVEAPPIPSLVSSKPPKTPKISSEKLAITSQKTPPSNIPLLHKNALLNQTNLLDGTVKSGSPLASSTPTAEKPRKDNTKFLTHGLKQYAPQDLPPTTPKTKPAKREKKGEPEDAGTSQKIHRENLSVKKTTTGDLKKIIRNLKSPDAEKVPVLVKNASLQEDDKEKDVLKRFEQKQQVPQEVPPTTHSTKPGKRERGKEPEKEEVLKKQSKEKLSSKKTTPRDIRPLEPGARMGPLFSSVKITSKQEHDAFESFKERRRKILMAFDHRQETSHNEKGKEKEKKQKKHESKKKSNDENASRERNTEESRNGRISGTTQSSKKEQNQDLLKKSMKEGIHKKNKDEKVKENEESEVSKTQNVTGTVTSSLVSHTENKKSSSKRMISDSDRRSSSADEKDGKDNSKKRKLHSEKEDRFNILGEEEVPNPPSLSSLTAEAKKTKSKKISKAESSHPTVSSVNVATVGEVLYDSCSQKKSKKKDIFFAVPEPVADKDGAVKSRVFACKEDKQINKISGIILPSKVETSLKRRIQNDPLDENDAPIKKKKTAKEKTPDPVDDFTTTPSGEIDASVSKKKKETVVARDSACVKTGGSNALVSKEKREKEVASDSTQEVQISQTEESDASVSKKKKKKEVTSDSAQLTQISQTGESDASIGKKKKKKEVTSDSAQLMQISQTGESDASIGKKKKKKEVTSDSAQLMQISQTEESDASVSKKKKKKEVTIDSVQLVQISQAGGSDASVSKKKKKKEEASDSAQDVRFSRTEESDASISKKKKKKEVTLDSAQNFRTTPSGEADAPVIGKKRKREEISDPTQGIIASLFKNYYKETKKLEKETNQSSVLPEMQGKFEKKIHIGQENMKPPEKKRKSTKSSSDDISLKSNKPTLDKEVPLISINVDQSANNENLESKVSSKKRRKQDTTEVPTVGTSESLVPAKKKATGSTNKAKRPSKAKVAAEEKIILPAESEEDEELQDMVRNLVAQVKGKLVPEGKASKKQLTADSEVSNVAKETDKTKKKKDSKKNTKQIAYPQNNDQLIEDLSKDKKLLKQKRPKLEKQKKLKLPA